MWEGSEVILLKWSKYLYHMSGVFKRKCARRTRPSSLPKQYLSLLYLFLCFDSAR